MWRSAFLRSRLTRFTETMIEPNEKGAGVKRIVQFILVILVSAVPALAETDMDPKVDSIMRAMSKRLDAATTVAFSAETTVDEVTASGQKLQRGSLVSVLVRRPAQVLAVRDGDVGVRKFLYDGKQITVYDPTLGLFATADVSGGVDQALDYLREKYDIVLPLGNLVRKGFYDQVRSKLTSGRYVGRHRVGRAYCHHLAFTSEEVDWQIWVEDSKEMLPRKIVVTYKTISGEPQFSALIGEWRLSESIPDKAFDLGIPPDASRIEILGKEEGQ